jgi:SEC-C motif-containing protein
MSMKSRASLRARPGDLSSNGRDHEVDVPPAGSAALSACPCGSGAAYAACCGPWHAGDPAPCAEALMRSRYSAYVLGLRGYLLVTWHPSRRPSSLEFEPNLRWLGLEVRHRHEDGDCATVEFVARSKLGGRAVRLHETSRFVREGGRWYYVEGVGP